MNTLDKYYPVYALDYQPAIYFIHRFIELLEKGKIKIVGVKKE